jgi:hypothetical protein
VHARLETLLEQARAARAANARELKVEIEPPANDSAPTAPSAAYAGNMAAAIAPSAAIAKEPAIAFPPALPADTSTDRVTAAWVEADAASAVAAVDASAFYDRAYDPALEAMIAHVVALEAPMRADVLAKRIARAHGWARTGTRIRDRVMEIAKRRFSTAAEDADVFVWPAKHDTSTWARFRRSDGNATRPVDEIALPELVALAAEVRAQGLTGEAAILAMARIAGLQQLRAASRERLERAWALASGQPSSSAVPAPR